MLEDDVAGRIETGVAFYPGRQIGLEGTIAALEGII